MAFTVEDFHDLIRLLEQHPDWNRELRRMVLSAELLSLPDLVRELGEKIAALTAAQERTEVRLSRLEGAELSRRFAERAPAYLGTLGYRRVRVIPTADWVDLIDDAIDAGRVSAADRRDLLRADAVVRARDEQGEVWLAVEVSATVDLHDIERARHWAEALVRLHGRAHPCVAGYGFTNGAEQELTSDTALIALTLPEL